MDRAGASQTCGLSDRFSEGVSVLSRTFLQKGFAPVACSLGHSMGADQSPEVGEAVNAILVIVTPRGALALECEFG